MCISKICCLKETCCCKNAVVKRSDCTCVRMQPRAHLHELITLQFSPGEFNGHRDAWPYVSWHLTCVFTQSNYVTELTCPGDLVYVMICACIHIQCTQCWYQLPDIKVCRLLHTEGEDFLSFLKWNKWPYLISHQQQQQQVWLLQLL